MGLLFRAHTLSYIHPQVQPRTHSLLLKGCCHEPRAIPGLVTFTGERFNLGWETRLDHYSFLGFQFSSGAQSWLTLCDPMDWSIPGLPVQHQLLELAQTHVHRVGDAIQPSHNLSSSPPAFGLSLHQGLLQWVSSLYQVVKVSGTSASRSVFPLNIQDWFPLRLTGWISLLSKEISKSLLQHHRSKASVLHSAFFMVQLSHPHMTTWKP